MNEQLSPPLLSLVVPTYGVERYLHDFLSNLAAQPLADTEVIFIDDGSPDRSAYIIEGWIAANPQIDALLLRQENRGLSEARNAGLARAHGTWISFPDPDDMFGTTYIEDISRAIAGIDDDVLLVAAPLVTYVEETGLTRFDHPLHSVFTQGAGVFRLEERPSAIKIHANSSFMRLARLREEGLKFDPTIRPNFEDTALITRYLAGNENPAIAVVPSAEYLYRTRADASSLVATSWLKPEKYTQVPEHGWLRLLEDVKAARGHVPVWVQNIVLYDMSWYFKQDIRIHTPTKQLDMHVREQFMGLVAQTAAYLDPEVILEYDITWMSPEIRALLLAMGGASLDWRPITVWRSDRAENLIQIRYYFTGERPTERFHTRKEELTPRYAKDRAVTYFGASPIHERIVWLEQRPGLRVQLNGQHRLIQSSSGVQPSTSLTPLIARKAGWRPRLPATLAAFAPRKSRWTDRQLARLRAEVLLRGTQIRRIREGRSPRFLRPADRLTAIIASRSRKYSDAWVFMDRDSQAQDNAEHLYRWVAAERPHINSWFVLSKHSPDWPRLAAEGFRLVPHGSWQHTLLLLNAVHLASSHVDHYVVQPLDPKRFPNRRWRYTFLQHGVTKGDISRWLNPKPIRRIISAAPSEHHAFVGDGTSYTFTEREGVLTGFPRHDALHRLAGDTRPRDRDSILVVPTWREYLLGPTNGKGNFRPLAEGFHESEYVTAWRAFLSSPELHAAAQKLGKKVVFLPHPNLEPHVAALDLPDTVEIRRYATSNIQETLAEAATMVTDYSSISFDGAYIGTPTVYFQFDREEFFASHPHRPGYFSDAEHGFGPVATDVAEAVSATISAVADAGTDEWDVYHRRISGFFAFQDESNCERVYEAMAALDTPEVF